MQRSLQKEAIVIRRAFQSTDILMNIFRSARSRNIHVFWPYNKRFSPKPALCGPDVPCQGQARRGVMSVVHPHALLHCRAGRHRAEQQPWTAAQPPTEGALSGSAPTAGGEKKKASLAKIINEQRHVVLETWAGKPLISFYLTNCLRNAMSSCLRDTASGCRAGPPQSCLGPYESTEGPGSPQQCCPGDAGCPALRHRSLCAPSTCLPPGTQSHIPVQSPPCHPTPCALCILPIPAAT